MEPDFDALTWDELRQRRSAKWRLHPADVLPVWVAELDVPLAEPVAAALRQAVDRGDTGYAYPVDLAPAFAQFAADRWSWQVDTTRCWPVADVMVGVAEALRVLTAPGDGVVVCPPVYHPFFSVLADLGRPCVEVPLVAGSWDLDLVGIDAALAAGARAVLLCSPHNPVGRVFTTAELAALDEIVRAHGAVVLSDEIHAPLTLAGHAFAPYLAAGEREAVAVVSASKAFNLAGLKAALLVAGSERVQARLQTMPVEVAYRVGHLGALASVTALTDGGPWLDALLRHVERQHDRLADLLREHLPVVRHARPQASYLAWLDLRALGLGDDPATTLLARGRAALVGGPEFGRQGAGWARLNVGTTGALLAEAVRRIAQSTSAE